MQEVLVNRLGGLSLPRKSVVRLTDRPDMTLDVYRGRKTTMQQQQKMFKTNNVLDNILLKFQTLISNKGQYFCWKNVRSFLNDALNNWTLL